MKAKVKPSEQMSNYVQSLLQGQVQTDELVSQLLVNGARQILQQAAEHEVDEYLGRGWYERKGNDNEDSEYSEFKGYRNGYTPKSIQSPLGRIGLQRPRVRDDQGEFESQLFTRLDAIDARLLHLATEMYVRGLSTRDIEQTLVDSQGKPILSRSVTSQLTDELYQQYTQWSKRSLEQDDVVYLFVDGVYESIRKYTNNQTILCAWGICSDGRKVLLGLQAVGSESAQAWEDFFQDLLARGMDQPVLTISDGCNGIIKAITKVFPYSDRGRCISHKLRNLLSKLPADQTIQKRMKSRLHDIYYAPTHQEGKARSEKFITEFADVYPALIACFIDDLQACLAHLNYPEGHRRSIRTTNLIERCFVEQKRRTKIIPTHVNEKGAMKLVFGTLIRASGQWQRVNMSPSDLALLRNIRKLITESKHITLTENRLSFKLAA